MTLDARSRQRLTAELREIDKQISALQLTAAATRDRQTILRSTIGCGIVSGSNAYNADQGKLPWMEPHEQMARYLDQPATTPKSLRPCAIARGHLKSEIGVHALTRHILKHPETRNQILTGTASHAIRNLSNVAALCQMPRFQAAFPDVLYPIGDEAYTKMTLTVKRKGAYREPTIMALGLLDNATGSHVGANSVAWIDDPVTKQNYLDAKELRPRVRDALIHYLSFICDPGAIIYLTHTRWGLDDAYATLLSAEGEWTHYVEPGQVSLGCYRVMDSGEPRPIYPLRYCWNEEDCTKPVVFRGRVYNVMRESLKAKERTVEPWEWNSQMLNDPQPESTQLFKPEWFDSVLPCDGRNLACWLDDPKNVKEFISAPADPREQKGWEDRGLLVAAISGDPSYGDKSHNDFQILVCAMQDRFNHLYIVEAYRKRLGYKGLEEYLRTALLWRRDFTVNRPVGIETHGKEALLPLADAVTRQSGEAPLRFAKLKANSNERKEIRISRLEPLFRGGKVHWCRNTDWFRKLARDEMSKFGAGAAHDDIGDCLSNLTEPEVLPARHGIAAIKPVQTSRAAFRYRGMRIAG